MIPDWMDAADAEADQFYVVNLEDEPQSSWWHHLSDVALCYLDDEGWSRDGSEFEVNPDARVYGPIPLDKAVSR